MVDSETPEQLRDEVLSLRAKNEQLGEALASARIIGAAVGIVIERQQLSYDDAFASLVAVSQQTNRKIRELAEEIVWTGVLPVAEPRGQ